MIRFQFRTTRRAVLLAGAAIMFTTANVFTTTAIAQTATPPAGKLETLADFLTRTRAATLESYRGQGGVQPGAQAGVRDDAAFAEMKEHILKLYGGVTARHSFVEDDHAVDCIPRDQQPSLQAAGKGEQPARPTRPVVEPRRERREKAPGATREIDLTLKRGAKDAYGNAMYCPGGTIPMRRLTLEDMTRFPSLRDYLRAGKRDDGSLDDKRGGELPADTADHYYARGTQFVDNHGGSTWLNVWSPTVASHHMSLSQLWVVGGTGSSKQTVESGWQVYPDKWGMTKAALFIFYTSKNYDDGCYNLDCTGFVQVANNVYLGRGFTNYSSDGGAQWGFKLQWKRNTDGNWWLFYRGPGDYIAVGYYPKSLFGTGTLASKATKVAFGGEDSGKPSAKQMGSGKKAADGWQHAAFQNRAFYISTASGSVWADLTKYEPDPTCYTADLHNIYGNWGTYLYFGGPSCN